MYHSLFPPGTCSPPKVTDLVHSPFPLNRLPPPPWTERPGGVRSARHLPIPGRFRVVDSPPTSLFLDSPGIEVAPLGLWAPSSSSHPLIIPRTLAEPVAWFPTPYRAPSPARGFGVGLKFKNQVQERPRRAKALRAASEPPCACGAKRTLWAESLDSFGPHLLTPRARLRGAAQTRQGQEPGATRAAKYTSKEQGTAGDWDPSPGSPS